MLRCTLYTTNLSLRHSNDIIDLYQAAYKQLIHSHNTDYTSSRLDNN
jgi:hypothetical protein